MTDQSFNFPRFFVTAPSPCPYLPNREERKVFTDLNSADASELNDALSRVGFRRSQSVAYRPACEGCNACVSVRVCTHDFIASKSMRKTYKQNRDLKVETMTPYATSEQYDVLKRYLVDRHAEGGMAEMDEFEYAEMVELSPITTSVIEYREPPGEHDSLKPGKLVGAAITDIMSDGLSMVYSFFDPDSERKSLGTFMILDHIYRAQKNSLPYVYLGYWVKGSKKMDYKTRFKPFERLTPFGWMREK